MAFELPLVSLECSWRSTALPHLMFNPLAPEFCRLGEPVNTGKLAVLGDPNLFSKSSLQSVGGISDGSTPTVYGPRPPGYIAIESCRLPPGRFALAVVSMRVNPDLAPGTQSQRATRHVRPPRFQAGRAT